MVTPTKRYAWFCIMLSTLACLVVSSGNAQQPAQQAQPLKCDIGPVARTYGATQWLVYSCDDNRSVVIVSAPGNPATPFYFFFFPSADGYQLNGEGTGQKDATNAAFGDLRKLSERDITMLIAETKRR